MNIVAQWVRTSWTKRSRGGPAAARRNAVPVNFVLPVLRCPLIHEVLMDETYDFKPRESLWDGQPDPVEVLLREVDGRLSVQLVITPFGRPRRGRRPLPVWLERGEWVRWQVNYRFSWPFSWPTASRGDWSYRLDTLNLAYGPTAVDVFTGNPTCRVDERGLLR